MLPLVSDSSTVLRFGLVFTIREVDCCNGQIVKFLTVAGAIAGCAARFVVGPLDVIKIRFQVQLEPIAKRSAALGQGVLTSKYTGLRQALTTILKEEGIPVCIDAVYSLHKQPT